MKYFNEPCLYKINGSSIVELSKNIGLFDYCVNEVSNFLFQDSLASNNIYNELEIFSYRYRLMATAGTLNLGRIKKLFPFNSFYELNKSEFLALYKANRRKKSKSHPFQQIIINCKENYNRYCYYCGVDHFENIDHFLPKGDLNSDFQLFFPQLSVMSYNLIPSCGTCNRTKSSHIGNYITETLIHPYFSKFLNDPFIYCNAHFNNGVVSFSYSYYFPDKWLNQNKIRAKNQINKFDLLNRYSVASSSEFKKHLIKYKRTLDKSGSDTLIDLIIDEYLSVKTALGVNHWETLMYLSLARNFSNFVDYLNTISTPQSTKYINPADISRI